MEIDFDDLVEKVFTEPPKPEKTYFLNVKNK